MGANKPITGRMKEIEKQYPGSWKVVGSFGDRGRVLSAGRIGVGVGGQGSPHRLRTSTQAPAAAPAAILLPSQAPGSVCPLLLWPPP